MSDIMKLFFVSFCALTMLFSCSTIEDNSPAFQGLNNNSFFKAVDSRAITGVDGSLIIQGENAAGEAVSFLVGDQGSSQAQLGGTGNNQNIAVYTDQFGNQFSTAFDDASGSIEYTLSGNESVSGEFNFTAFTPGKTDTVTFSRGFIFQVPFLVDVPVELPDATIEDQFTARINTVIFNPTIIGNTISDGELVISGQTSTRTLTLVMPADITAGNYEFEEGTSIFATFTNSMGTNTSTSGTLQIISNDTTENIISGEFVFETPGGFIITDGAFVINY